jgi:hypothetical protein
MRFGIHWDEPSTWRGVVAVTVAIFAFPQAHGVQELMALGFGLQGLLGIATTDKPPQE